MDNQTRSDNQEKFKTIYVPNEILYLPENIFKEKILITTNTNITNSSAIRAGLVDSNSINSNGTNKILNRKMLMLCLYLMIKKGIDNTLGLSINHLVQWCGFKPNKHEGKINVQYKILLEYLQENEYLIIKDKLSDVYFSEIKLNEDKFKSKDNFTIIYLDEIQKIFDFISNIQMYKEFGLNKGITISEIMIVFFYLRNKIPQRNLNPTNGDSALENQVKYPEAFNCFIKDIGEEVCINERKVSKIIRVLEELELIHHLPLGTNRYKGYNDGKDIYITGTTIFTNYYKRYNGSEIMRGTDYFMNEIENKKKKLRGLLKTNQ